MTVIEEFVSTRARKDLYDENNNYLPEVAQEAYLVALDEALSAKENYYKTVEFELRLVYSDDVWQVELPQELIRALAGGVS